jgi:hypothetical protein
MYFGMSCSYLCVPITGTSVLSLLVGFSEAIVLVRYRDLIVLLGLGNRLAVCKNIGRNANIQSALVEECLSRWEVGHKSAAGIPRRRRLTGAHARSAEDAGTKQFWVNLRSSSHTSLFFVDSLLTLQGFCWRCTVKAYRRQVSSRGHLRPPVLVAYWGVKASTTTTPAAARDRTQPPIASSCA